MTPDPNREGYLQMVEASSPLHGRFSDIRRIGTSGGSGNFSLVFTAKDNTCADRIALKFFNPSFAGDLYRWNSFAREESILGELSGQRDIITRIAPMSNFTIPLKTTSGITLAVDFSYYGMELAKTDVATVILNSPWDAETNLLAFQSMCRAVQRIHANQLCHRDLKPGNFLVMHDDGVRLSDFGTACKLDGQTPHILPNYSFPPGDRRYSAPEMIACLHDEWPEAGRAGDIFSLGAILFELFTGIILGQHLFTVSFHADLMKVMTAVPTGQRRRIFDQIISGIAANHPLPDVQSLGPGTPPIIRDRINSIYKSLAALDYSRRLYDFSRIFLQIETCLWILRNDEKYRRWYEQKRLRAERRQQRLEEISKRFPKGGPRKC